MKPGFAEVRIQTLLAPLVKIQVPGKFCLQFIAGLVTYALRENYGVVEASVTTDDAEWCWSTDPLGAGDQIFRGVSRLESMVQ